MLGKISLVLLAAGNSRRFKECKLSLKMTNHKTVVTNVIDVFVKTALFSEIIFVNAKKPLHKGNVYLKIFKEKISTKVVTGGAERYLSVINGLKNVDLTSDYVFVHDAARPYVSSELIHKLLTEITTNNHDGVVPCVVPRDAIKEIQNGFVSQNHSRNSVLAAQTPQVFRIDFIRQLLEHLSLVRLADMPFFSDECEMMMHYFPKIKIKAISGEQSNRKITFPFDVQRGQKNL